MKVEQAKKLSRLIRQAGEIVKDSVDDLTKLAADSILIFVENNQTNRKDLSFGNSQDRLLNKSELAERLNVSVRTVNNLQSEGMPSVEIFTRVLFDYDEVLIWVKDRDFKPRQKNNLRVVK